MSGSSSVLPARRTGICGEITYLTGATRAFTEEQAVSFSRSEGVQNGMLLGAALSASYQLTLDNADGAFTFPHTPYGAQIRVSLTENGRAVPVGVFTVTQAGHSETTGRLTLSGADAMGTAFEAAWEDDLTYPMTLGSLAGEIINRVGFTCSDSLSGREQMLYRPPEWGDITLRRALSYVLQAAGSFALVDGSGALRFLPVWPDDAVYTVSADCTFRRTLGSEFFGPLQGISVMPFGSRRDALPIIVKEEGAVLSGQNCLYLSGNPLLTADSGLPQTLFDAIRGLSLTRVQVQWAGDPALKMGDRFSTQGAGGDSVSAQVTRQSLTFDQGLSMQTDCTVSRSDNAVGRLITASGTLNASMLQGEVDGKNLMANTVAASALIAGSITAAQLAASSVTADKLASASVTAEKLIAGAVTAEQLSAGAVTAGKIGAGAVTTQKLAAEAVTAAKLAAGAVEAGHLSAGAMEAVDARIGSADINFAQIKDAVIEQLITKDALSDRYYIRKLQVDNLQAISLDVNNLVVKAADGNYYALDVDENGEVTATRVTVTASEIAAGVTSDGSRSIIETDLLVTDLAATNIKGVNALLDKIMADRINVNTLFAREAVIPQLEALDISGNQYLRLMVDGKVDSKVDELKVGGRNYLRNSSDMDYSGYYIAGAYTRNDPYIGYGEIDYAELED